MLGKLSCPETIFIYIQNPSFITKVIEIKGNSNNRNLTNKVNWANSYMGANFNDFWGG